ncbi:4Fe-4S binding protein [Bellilinea sp.]|uniref:4Fe-4S binding protein n=1 Tax=Bellilinea sp. TaxID=2838785 RepID=UPI003A0FDF80
MYQITEDCAGCGMCRSWCPVKAIRGYKKKRHIIEPHCISCGVCGRVCGYGVILDDAGRVTSRIPIREWFRPAWDYLRCNGCGQCVSSCPVKCIQITNAGEGLENRPFLTHPGLCIGCQFCKNACEYQAIYAL